MSEETMKTERVRRELGSLRRRITEFKAGEGTVSPSPHLGTLGSAILETLDALVAVVDARGRILALNRASERLSGYSFEEVRERPYLEVFVPPEDREERLAEFAGLLRDGGPAKFVNEWLTRSGERRLIEWSCSVLRDPEGLPPCIVGTGIDVTERAAAQQALGLEKRRAQDYFSIAGVMIVMIGSDRKVRDINRKGCEILGYPEEEIVGEDWFDKFLPERLRGKTGEVFECLVRGGTEPHEYHENPVVTQSGEERLVAWHNTVVRDEEGRIIGTLSSGEDITERRRAEDALRRSRDRLIQAQHTARVGFIDWDLSTGEIVWSDEVFEITGTGPGAGPATMSRMLELVHPDDRPRVRESFDRVAGSGGTLDIEHRIVRADGELLWLHSQGELVRDAEGKPAAVNATVIDVTKRVRLEQELRQSQKLEAIGRLAGGLAHDFNNLLTVMSGYAEILHIRLGPDHVLTPKAGEILRAAARAGDLTRQLLAFSHRQMLEPRILDLNLVLLDMDKMLRRLIGEDVHLDVVTDEALSPVIADPSQVEQVIVNLAVNARDAMPEGGMLTFETRNVDLHDGFVSEHPGSKPGPHVLLTAVDTGHGMSPEVRARVFEPFFTTKERTKGTGLGLSTVYGIVKQSEGCIYVRSEVGKGTAFEVYLPAVEGEAQPLSPMETAGEAPGGRETVLLVEDEAGVRSFAKEVLTEAGYEVLEAADGHEGIAAAERHRGKIDLILTDMVMPNVGGAALVEALSSSHPEAKVLFTTGYFDRAAQLEEQPLTGSRLLQKPFSREVLLGRAREVLDSQPGR